jgi:hypothetical protein
VNAISALANDALDLSDSLLSAVLYLARAASQQPAVLDDEHQSMEERQVAVVEGAVDEDATVVAGWHRRAKVRSGPL